MTEEQGRVSSQDELAALAEQFRDKRYRDGYVAAHTRSVLARQMRNFRGDNSQVEFGAEIGKRQTVVSRLESPAYAGWSLRTMLEVAHRRNVAVFCRFVDFPTFLKYSRDLSAKALCPPQYDPGAIQKLAHEERRTMEASALKALFGGSFIEAGPRSGALDAMQRMHVAKVGDHPSQHAVVPELADRSELGLGAITRRQGPNELLGAPLNVPANDDAPGNPAEPKTRSLLSAV
jgi:hypothetical protein